jgi:hypothetical protein
MYLQHDDNRRIQAAPYRVDIFQNLMMLIARIAKLSSGKGEKLLKSILSPLKISFTHFSVASFGMKASFIIYRVLLQSKSAKVPA